MSVKLNIEKKDIKNVKPIILNNQIKKEIKGRDYIPYEFCNCFIVGRKMSGKSNLLFHLVKHTLGKKTKIIFFVSTIKKDDNYREILQYLRDHKIKYVIETSFYNKLGEHQLAKVVEYLKNEDEDPLFKDYDDSVDVPPPKKIRKSKQPTSTLLSEDISVDKNEKNENYADYLKQLKPKKWDKNYPEYIFVLDDMSKEIKADRNLESFLKEHRHMKSKVFVCSQSAQDIHPDAINQIDICCLFPRIPSSKSDSKLEKLMKNLGIDMDYEIFKQLYKKATAPDLIKNSDGALIKDIENNHNFFYVDAKARKFRRNLDEIYNLTEIDSDSDN